MAGLFNPKNAVEGGFFNNFDGTIVGAEYVRTDYAGKQTEKVPVLQLTIQNDEEPDVKPFFSSYKVGKAEDWAPSPDGKSMMNIGKAGLNTNSSIMLLTKHMEVVGVPEEILDSIDEDVTKLVGLKVHWENLERSFDDKGGNKVSYKVLVPTSLIALPGENAAAPTANPNLSLATARVGAYIGAAKKKTVNKADLVSLVLSDGEIEAGIKNDVIKLVIEDSFLTAGPWKYEGGVLKG
jgi:hypothetical protein